MTSKDNLDDDDFLSDKSGQTHTFVNFPDSAVDDDEESGDKSQLLKDEDGKKPSASFWTFEYYQQFFDVETRQVFHRITGSMIPIPNRSYLSSSIRPNPDLYGPFWICTTLVFTTAIAGNLANYLSSGGKDYHWRYDFHKVTFAAAAIFSYWWLVPMMLYGTLWWRRSQAGFTFLEILCLYGYSLAIYIPISILWVINVTWLKWLLVIVAAVLSGGVLVLTFWPAVKEDAVKVAAIFVGVVFILHLALAAGFVLYFFHVPPSSGDVAPKTTAPPSVKPTNKIPENIKAAQSDQSEGAKQLQAAALTNQNQAKKPDQGEAKPDNNKSLITEGVENLQTEKTKTPTPTETPENAEAKNTEQKQDQVPTGDQMNNTPDSKKLPAENQEVGKLKRAVRQG